MFLILLILLAVSGIFVFFIFRPGKKGKENKEKNNGLLQFYAKGKDLGFSFKEIELLRRLAVKSNIENPAALFGSQAQLDTCIRSLVRSIRLSGTRQDLEIQGFLTKLYDYRKKIEFEQTQIKSGLSSTRQIGEAQNVRILAAGTGVFPSQLVKNTGRYITVAKPAASNLPPGFSWAGRHLSVYFWRDDDAGYVFDSDVAGEAYFKGLPVLQIAHADTLFRAQKRKSVRMKIHKPASLYLHGQEDPAARVVPGLKCVLDNISDTGCAVTIGGKAVPGLRVEIQFALDTSPVTVCGTVRSVNYNEAANRSVLHIEADPLSPDVRNEILGEIFGTQDDDEALPFRIMEEPHQDGEGGGAPAGGGLFTEVELHDIPNDTVVNEV